MKKVMLVTLIVTLSLSTLLCPIGIYAHDDSGKPLRIIITKARPAILDDDGLENDVVVKGLISVTPDSKVEVYFILTNPEGMTTLTDTFEIDAPKHCTKYQIELGDVLSIPGWYVIKGYANCEDEFDVSNPYHFDPSGGTSGPGF